MVVAQLAKKYSKFYGTRKFIAVITTVHHWTLSWAIWIVPTHSTYSLILVLILSFHLRLGIPSAFLIPRMCVTCFENVALLEVITSVIFYGEFRSWSSSVCATSISRETVRMNNFNRTFWVMLQVHFLSYEKIFSGLPLAAPAWDSHLCKDCTTHFGLEWVWFCNWQFSC